MDANNKELNLKSDEVQDVLSEIPPVIERWGITLVFLIVFVLIVGSFLFKYPNVVVASITLTSQEPPASILARATGKIDEIYVKNGQHVSTGARLGVIQNPARTSDVTLLSEKLARWTKQHSDLSMASIVFDETPLQLGAVQNSYVAFLSLLNEYLTFNELQYYPKKIKLQLSEVRIQSDNILEMNRQDKLLRQQLESANSVFIRDSVLFKKGVASREDFETSRTKLLQMKQSYSSLCSSIRQTEIAITQCRGTLLDLQQQYAANENKFKHNLQMAEEQLLTQIKTWEKEFLMVSPIDGVVNLMGYWSSNQNVQSGETIFTIQPDLKTLPIGKALMPAQGSGKVKVGQRVNVRLNNFPDQEFGFLVGEVRSISNLPNTQGYYVVEVRFPKGLNTNYGKKLPMTRQMEGSADIITEDIRLIERLVNPIKQLLKKHI